MESIPPAELLKDGILILIAIFSWINNRQAKATHLSVNSMKDALIKAASDAAWAKGVIEGREMAAREAKDEGLNG